VSYQNNINENKCEVIIKDFFVDLIEKIINLLTTEQRGINLKLPSACLPAGQAD
jgi:hypothetical protein